MKKITTSLLAFFIAVVTFAAIPVTITKEAKPLRADEMMISLPNSEQKISLAEYVKLSPKEYKNLTGEKLSLKEKFTLKISQHQLKKTINSDGTLNTELYKKYGDEDRSFNLGWFALGFLFGPIPVIIALFIKDDKHHARINWMLIGWAASAAISLILLAVSGGSTY